MRHRREVPSQVHCLESETVEYVFQLFRLFTDPMQN